MTYSSPKLSANIPSNKNLIEWVGALQAHVLHRSEQPIGKAFSRLM